MFQVPKEQDATFTERQSSAILISTQSSISEEF